MRSTSLVTALCSTLVLAGCTDPDATDPVRTEAGAQLLDARGPKKALYRVEHLGTLGGNSTRGNAIDVRGRVAGYANLPGNERRVATLWTDDEPIALGTLGGPHSNVPSAGLNVRGMVAGIAEMEDADPLGQVWSCTQFFFPLEPTGRICRGFVWEDGEMEPLPTLGGYNGFAMGINTRGQIVGWAETGEPDDTCIPERVLGFKAVLWEPKKDRFRPLPPLPGHTASAATAINERGQVVGISGDCDQAVGRFSARNAVLWDRGRVVDLGGLGGVSWQTPWAINERGEVVGFGNPPGDEDGGFNAKAFYWSRRTGMVNLGTLPGNGFAQAQGINTRGVAVGVSFGGESPQRAFIWHRGDEALTDLNELVVPGYTGTLIDARHINERGQISGSAVTAEGDVVPFVATPVGRVHGPRK